jgi:hypothetical protein
MGCELPVSALKWHQRISLRTILLTIVVIVAGQALVLLAFGLPAICKCGYVALWHGNPSGPETSQHLMDWYTYTHVIHGFGFYLLLWLIAPRMSFGLRLAIATGLEAGWEVIENTSFIMERYRQSALARGYFGDSIVNSVSDTLAAMLGFVLARQLPIWSTVALAIVMELFAAYMIHDNLTLNIIQLIHPNGVVSLWQAGG